MTRAAFACGLLLVCGAADAFGQQRTAGEWAWKSVVLQDSVRVRYLFYSEADNVNNGVVLRLDNHASRAVAYRFVALFRSGDDQVEQEVTGRLDAQETITGEADGLFFIPFEDGRGVEQIGLRGFRVWPAGDPP
ncbi:MAG: hypothetical protein HKN29_05600 [Rhodothermales bacterium]|nr:hypothetical protein [Rhodothermales bacterium]